MAATVLLIICILGVFIGFYLVVLTQLSWYYAMMITAGGAVLLGSSVLQAQTAIEKVKGLLSCMRLGHVLWANLFILSVWIFRGRDAAQLAQNPVDSAALVRILSVAVAGVIVFIIGLVERKEVIGQLLHGLPGLMFAYGFVGLASGIYSPFRALSVYKACEIIVDVSMIAFFLACYPSRTDMKRWIDFNWFMVALLIASVLVGAILFPKRAFHPVSANPSTANIALFSVQIHGLMPIMNPNSLGVLSALLSIVSLSRILHARNQNERTMYITSLVVGVITLVLAQARTSLFGGLLAIMAVLFFNKRFKLLVFVALLLVLAIILSDFPSLLLKYVMRGQSSTLFYNLSGRTVYWSFAWEKFLESPIYGYGLSAGTRYVVLAQVGRGAQSTMHNSWLEVLVNVGIVGLIPVALAYVGTWWTLLRISFRPPAWFDRTVRMLSIEMIGLLIILSVRLITGGHSFLHDRELLLYLLVVAYAQQIRNWEKEYE